MRSAKDIDLLQVEKLSAMHCTDKEIAAFFDVCDKTIARRKKENPLFKQAIERGREKGKINLRQWQFEEAEAKSIPMLIWLGKVYLGQREDQMVRINFNTCKNNLDKMNRVINAVGKGKITPKDGETLIRSLQTVYSEEDIQYRNDVKELQKRVDAFSVKEPDS